MPDERDTDRNVWPEPRCRARARLGDIAYEQAERGRDFGATQDRPPDEAGLPCRVRDGSDERAHVDRRGNEHTTRKEDGRGKVDDFLTRREAYDRRYPQLLDQVPRRRGA